MENLIKIFMGIVILVLAYPLGTLLRNSTKDELKQGKIYFKIITFLGLISGLIGLIILKDWLLFTGFFFAIIASQSLKEGNISKNNTRKSNKLKLVK